jgi:Protein of unknown function (DUF3562)
VSITAGVRPDDGEGARDGRGRRGPVRNRGARGSGARPRGSVVLETIVERVATEFGAAREEVRSRALELLSGYADARVRSFVPILVEKRLRETYRTPGPAG